MTRSNMFIVLSNGTRLHCVADSSSAPEQGYIVEQVILPLLSFNDPGRERALLEEHCTMGELRVNAMYRYEIDLRDKSVSFYEENYNWKEDSFRRGNNITKRYTNYHLTIPKNNK